MNNNELDRMKKLFQTSKKIYTTSKENEKEKEERMK